MPKIILITGPCASGKTTITNLISKKFGFPIISGDKIKKEYFPNIKDIEKYPEKIDLIRQKIFKQAEKYFLEDQTALIDYIYLNPKDFDKFKNTFSNNFILKILLPSLDTLKQRNSDRDCWQVEEESLTNLYNKFSQLKNILDKDFFIDNSCENVGQTAENILIE